MKFHLGLYAILPNSASRQQVYAWFYSVLSLSLPLFLSLSSAGARTEIQTSVPSRARRSLQVFFNVIPHRERRDRSSRDGSHQMQRNPMGKTRGRAFLRGAIKQILRIPRE